MIRPALPRRSRAAGRVRVSDSPANLTQLLRAAAAGGRGNVDALMAAIYDDLRRLALGHLRSERQDHTLQPTALVHEAYLKLIDQRLTDWKDRAHFFAVASRIIRRILVDHARERGAAKRGGGSSRVAIDDVELAASDEGVDLMALDDALAALAEIDAVQAQVVEMRYFGGLTIEEIAEALDIGKRSVDRHWQVARTWLCFRLADSAGEQGDER
jgi:RNA polymerase sigma-70 factor, ECF subfamily